MPRCRNCGCELCGENARQTTKCPNCDELFWKKTPDGTTVKQVDNLYKALIKVLADAKKRNKD
jgi:primosomal protein N'